MAQQGNTPSFAGEPLHLSVRHYAEQWEGFDREAWSDLSAGNSEDRQLDAVSRIMGKYRVARSLKREHDIDAGLRRFGPLLEAVSEVREGATETSTAPQLVHRLFLAVRERYAVQAVSLCSKVLWFAMRSPVVIYDDNALQALRVAPGSYGTFYSEWQRQYTRIHASIDEALAVTSFKGLSVETKALAQEEWFKERVFDIACWRAGDRLR